MLCSISEQCPSFLEFITSKYIPSQRLGRRLRYRSVAFWWYSQSWDGSALPNPPRHCSLQSA
jgi:hypothetical protein